MLEAIVKLYALVKPYGRGKLLLALAVSLLYGVVMTASVVSLFPFLAVAAEPDAARESAVIQYLLYFTGELSNGYLISVVGGIAITTICVSNVVKLLSTYIMARFTFGLGQFLRSRLFESISYQEYSYFLHCSPGVIIKKVNSDGNNVINLIVSPLLVLFSSALNVAMLATSLLFVAPGATLFVAITIAGVYALLFRAFSSIRREYSRSMLEMARESNRVVHQAVSAIKPLKIHGVESVFLDRFEKYVGNAVRFQRKQAVAIDLPRSVVEPLGISLLISFVIYSVLEGKDLSNILPLVGLLGLASYRILPNIQAMYTSLTKIGSNEHIVEELADELLSMRPSIDNRPLHENSTSRLELCGQIEIRDLSFSYGDNNRKVIDSLDYTIPKGQSIAMVGTTGCGKSTFVDLLLGLHEPTSGGVFIDSVRLDRTNRRRWQNNVGYVPQDIVLLDDTVVANIALGVAEDSIDWDKLKRACKAAEILEFVESELEKGWKTVVGERGVRLSGGQRQRIGIARALYHEPGLLILDEATSALDHETETKVMKSIEKLEGEMTMVIIAHRLSTIQWCDQVLDLTTVTPKWSLASPTEIMRNKVQ